MSLAWVVRQHAQNITVLEECLCQIPSSTLYVQNGGEQHEEFAHESEFWLKMQLA